MEIKKKPKKKKPTRYVVARYRDKKVSYLKSNAHLHLYI